jgi:hypothetical protein
MPNIFPRFSYLFKSSIVCTIIGTIIFKLSFSRPIRAMIEFPKVLRNASSEALYIDNSLNSAVGCYVSVITSSYSPNTTPKIIIATMITTAKKIATILNNFINNLKI